MKTRHLFAFMMGLAALVFIARPAMAQDPSLVLYLSFDERAAGDAVDLSGKNNHAVFMGKAKRGEGKYGKGVEMGMQAHLEVPHDDTLNLTKEMTLMTWVKLLQDTGDHQSAIEKGSGWVVGEYNLLGDYNNQVLLQMHDLPDNCNDELFVGNVMDGQWHHIAGTWDGDKITIYIDGDKVGGGDCAGEIGVNGDPLYIGARGGSSRWTMGFYDEIRVYNRALSRSEIREALKGPEDKSLSVNPQSKAAIAWGALKASAIR